jgi:hypothetical protein
VRQPRAERPPGLFSPFRAVVREGVGLVNDVTLRPAVSVTRGVVDGVASVTVRPVADVSRQVARAVGDATIGPAAQWAQGAADTLQAARREVRVGPVGPLLGNSA